MNDICEQVRDLLAHNRSNLNFSTAAHYAVRKLCDYAEQEHELRVKAEERCTGLQRQVLEANQTTARTSRTNDDLRQQLSFMQQMLVELQSTGV